MSSERNRYLSLLSPSPQESDLPRLLPSPFSNTPHPLAIRAAEQLQTELKVEGEWQHDFSRVDGGKMFGVLVVREGSGRIGFLSAFSGMLAGRWVVAGFVPPLFNQVARDAFLPLGEVALADATKQIQALQNSAEYAAVQVQIEALLLRQAGEVEALKGLNKKRKAQRQQQRSVLAQERSAERRERVLVTLSFESQRDKRELRDLNAQWREQLAPLQASLESIETQIEVLKKARSRRSNRLHRELFATYTLSNWQGEKRRMASFFDEHRPPGGAGDCAAPKLIHYAQQHNLMPLALAEFWWGAPPREGVRHHAHYYPACRGKCRPILPFMLKGVEVQETVLHKGLSYTDDAPETIYEDDDLLVVNKPCGLLSIPGKEVQDSVLTRLQQRYPQATGALLVHRLDMSTSGVLLAAKNAKTHKALQQQFEQRSVEKRYLAVLSKRLPDNQSSGTIELPLRVDLDDRPRQRVCFAHGRSAKTHWRVISREAETTRVYFYPITGRTHQLRLHAAYHEGLNAPIRGDELYGKSVDRLLLHAERLRFTHPATGQRIELKVPAPF